MVDAAPGRVIYAASTVKKAVDWRLDTDAILPRGEPEC